MAAGRKALVVATYEYADGGLRRLAAPEHDAEALAAVLEDPAVAGFDVTMLVNQPHHVVGEAIADFYTGARRDDLTLLYFTGHGLKDDEGRLYLAMTNTRRSALMFTAISGAQLNDAMDASASRRKVLILDCCYSGAFPSGRRAKADEGVQTLERFQGKGRAVLTASDATQYAFEGDDLRGTGTSSVFTRYLVEAISSGAADLDEDGDIALDELYSYVYDRVTTEMPQQRPKKQEDVDGRILIARNVHWTLPVHLQHVIESPIAAQRLSAVQELEHLHRAGNDIVRAAVAEQLAVLAADDSRSVAAAASGLQERLGLDGGTSSERTVREPAAETRAVQAPGGPAAVTTGAASGVSGPARRPPVTAKAPPPDASATPRRSATPAGPTVDGRTRGRAAGPDDAAQAQPPGALPLLLTVTLVGGVLLLLSRFLVFESTYTVVAADFQNGIHWISWVIGAGLPLLVAFQLLVVRGTAAWGVALAGGMVGGAALSQLDLVLATWAYFRTPETSEMPGPGWWATLLGAVVLLGGAVVVLRQPSLRARPGVRSDWRAFSGVLLVVGGLAAWLTAQDEASPWLTFNEPALLLAAVCFPVVVLDLDRAQRLFGLATATVLAVWVASGHVQALVIDNFPVDARATVVALVSVVCSLAGCYLSQARTGRRLEGDPIGSR
ncbi:caspase family protein [Blastococcus mobilis]|uniref:Caspase domain-containing protein n=1 Tax=Blastococcus mobilis TaxID=1938746 RepID=A0A238VEE6_9ACTN|nr:caspase family protein [Blastococcus mobilis]SNR32417.1 Caspase domain-containing protein [Blastococcus mobilis]